MQKENGHNGKTNGFSNGRYKKKRVQFVAIKFRVDIAEKFKDAAFNNEMNYTRFLEELMKSEMFEEIFDRPENRDAINNFIRHVAKRAMQPSREDNNGNVGYKF